MRRSVCAGLVVMALLLTGCSRAAQPEAQALSAAQPATDTPQVSQLRAQVHGLQALADNIPVSYLAEPTTQVSDGTYEMIVDDVLTSAGPPAMVVDFVTPGSVPGTDSYYWNKFKRGQRVEVDGSAVIAIRDSDWNLRIVSFKDFAGHWHASDSRSDTGYWVDLEHGRITHMWEAWVP